VNANESFGPRTPLVPAHRRRAAWCVVVLLAAIVAIFGVILHGDPGAPALEQRFFDYAFEHGGDRRQPWQDIFNTVLPLTTIVATCLVAAWSLALRWWRGVAACAAVPVAIVITSVLLKPLVDRAPPGSVLLYPSGHVTAIAAASTLVFLIFCAGVRSAAARTALAVALGVVCFVGMFASVVGGYHWPLDTVGGLATGAAVVTAWALLVDLAFEAGARRGRAGDDA
jgi:undecaprenyl-diphosphatase